VSADSKMGRAPSLDLVRNQGVQGTFNSCHCEPFGSSAGLTCHDPASARRVDLVGRLLPKWGGHHFYI
jgi:hypothetical protein